ncbi:MAG: DJ-1/PfpI family protein [Treponema sp.]|nr:DJ-1/PfpI family protein [Treponema sp.]MCL2272990.1 DJ-1/PfpI family protein [Treponema sp.]MCL2273233.1 DJ-1/PfpI family protein [Treponema sp.]
MQKKVLVLLADGFEDVEAVTPIDYLRRAGIEVTTASISGSLTVTSRWGGIKITADAKLAELLKLETNIPDAVILPGGMPGASNLAASKETGLLLIKMAAAGKLICAICASPAIVLAPLGLLSGRKFTCFPGMEEKVTDGVWSDSRTVTDGNIITSRAAGTAGEWSIAVISALLGETEGKKITETILLIS